MRNLSNPLTCECPPLTLLAYFSPSYGLIAARFAGCSPDSLPSSVHPGVHIQSGLAHSALVTAANVHSKHALPHLLHGREERVYGDNAYMSQKALKAPQGERKRSTNALFMTNSLRTLDDIVNGAA